LCACCTPPVRRFSTLMDTNSRGSPP